MYRDAQLYYPTPTGLGLVAAGKRNIQSGHNYNQYFNLDGVDSQETKVAHGTTFRTLDEMKKVVRQTLSHTKNISQKIKGITVNGTLSHLYNFLYQHIQYTPDKQGVEQLRTPLRTWYDRVRGVDCDCYSIFISSVLHNLGIPHAFRMTDYGQGWQHVYVVVPHNGKKSGLKQRNGYTVIDPVIDQFNYEKPFTDKYDKFMDRMPITVLSGVENTTCPPKQDIYHPEYYSLTEIANNGEVATEVLLNELGLPVQNEYSATGKPMVNTTINGDTHKLETIISQQKAEEIKALVSGDLSTTDNTAQAGIMPSKNGLLTTALIIFAGVGFIYSMRPTNRSKGDGLGNPNRKPSANSKRKPKPRKKARVVQLS